MAVFRVSSVRAHSSPAASLSLPKSPPHAGPIDIVSRVDKRIKTSVGNEFCAIDAFEDTQTVHRAIRLLNMAHATGKPFYLGVGLHKVAVLTSAPSPAG